MNDLIYSCTSDLDQPSTPYCGTDYGERVIRVLFSKSKVTTTANVPAASDFNNSYPQLTIFNNITRGHRTFLGETEINWHNREFYDKTYRVEGRILRLNNSIIRATELMNRKVYMYFFTEKNYCFGPYYTRPQFDHVQLETKGQPPFIDFTCDYIGHGIDYYNKDSGYANLHDTYTSVTVDSTLITVDSTIITADQT